jgi:hypothetical protein
MKTQKNNFKSVPIVSGHGLHHKQVKLTHPTLGYTAEVDEDISPLIQLLWDKGLDTGMSCQENQPGLMWIEFPSFLYSEVFITMAFQSAPDEKTYWRVRGEEEYWSIYEDEDPPPWQYDFILDDLSEYYSNGKIQYKGSRESMILTSIRFPISDYHWILEAAKSWPGWIDHDWLENNCGDTSGKDISSLS